MFGSRKIYLRMKNNNLFVHVGGDLLNINEFLRTHVDSELNRMASEHDSQILNLQTLKEEGYDFSVQVKQDSEDFVKVAELSPKRFVYYHLLQEAQLFRAFKPLTYELKFDFV